MPNPSQRRILAILPGVPYQGLFQDPWDRREYFPIVSHERVWDSILEFNPTKLILIQPMGWTDYVRGGIVALCRHRKIALIRHARERADYNRERAMLDLGLEEPTPQSDILAHLLTHLDELETVHMDRAIRS